MIDHLTTYCWMNCNIIPPKHYCTCYLTRSNELQVFCHLFIETSSMIHEPPFKHWMAEQTKHIRLATKKTCKQDKKEVWRIIVVVNLLRGWYVPSLKTQKESNIDSEQWLGDCFGLKQGLFSGAMLVLGRLASNMICLGVHSRKLSMEPEKIPPFEREIHLPSSKPPLVLVVSTLWIFPGCFQPSCLHIWLLTGHVWTSPGQWQQATLQLHGFQQAQNLHQSNGPIGTNAPVSL